MPGTGRYVYRSEKNRTPYRGHYWYWQCDLCGASGGEYEGMGFYIKMQRAFEDCLIHARECIDRPIRYEEN